MSSIQVNGRPQPLDAPVSVTVLLETLGLSGKPVVIELNGEALLRDDYPGTLVHPGATLEIVTLAAGGRGPVPSLVQRRRSTAPPADVRPGTFDRASGAYFVQGARVFSTSSQMFTPRSLGASTRSFLSECLNSISRTRAQNSPSTSTGTSRSHSTRSPDDW